MPSEAQTPPTPKPSVFISYASEDRAAARLLRDALNAAGLDVWHDEQELGGGDAWDQKIRRQIRDCEYFMPVISATTEARREGYFRREWRLACERSLDMADDVLFIVPVVIDDTAEIGARVPDKFLTVQWVRAPGGTATPALHHLVRRLLAGDHHLPLRPSVTRPPMQRTQAPFQPPLVGEPPPLAPAEAAPAPRESQSPPPMPPFPQPPDGGVGHWIKFLAEVFWWGLTVVWMLFVRLPRWARFALVVWFILVLFGPCKLRTNSPTPSRPPKSPPAASRDQDFEKAMSVAGEQLANAFTEAGKARNKRDHSKIGEEMARRFGKGLGLDLNALGKPLVLAPFAAMDADEPAGKFANAVFQVCAGQLAGSRPGEIAILSPLEETATDETLAAAGHKIAAEYILGARVTTDSDAPKLAVRLVNVRDGSIAWSQDFAITGEARDAGQAITEAALAAVPKREPRTKKEK